MIIMLFNAAQKRPSDGSGEPFTDESFTNLVATSKMLRTAKLIPHVCYSGGGRNLSDIEDVSKRRYWTARILKCLLPEDICHFAHLSTSQVDHIYNRIRAECLNQKDQLSTSNKVLLFVDHGPKIDLFVEDVLTMSSIKLAVSPLKSTPCALTILGFNEITHGFFLYDPDLICFTDHHHNLESASKKLQSLLVNSGSLVASQN